VNQRVDGEAVTIHRPEVAGYEDVDMQTKIYPTSRSEFLGVRNLMEPPRPIRLLPPHRPEHLAMTTAHLAERMDETIEVLLPFVLPS